MCVIIYQPETAHLDKELAEKHWKANPDGGSFTYVEDERIVIKKFMQFKEFWSEFEQTRSRLKTSFVIHMRIATHGSVCENNVHPFWVDAHTVMAHNGTISNVDYFMGKDDDRTDSQFFVDEYLRGLPETWLDNEFLSDLVNDYVSPSRLLFLTTNPLLEYQIYRFGKWTEHKGMFFSNSWTLEPGSKQKKGTITANKKLEEYWPTWYDTDDSDDSYFLEMQKLESSPNNLPLIPWEESRKRAYQARDELMEAVYEFTTPDQKENLENLVLLREQLYLNAWPLDLVPEGNEEEVVCIGCDDVVDYDGSCECWSYVCERCDLPIAICDHTAWDATPVSIQYERLNDVSKAFVHNRLRNHTNLETDVWMALLA